MSQVSRFVLRGLERCGVGWGDVGALPRCQAEDGIPLEAQTHPEVPPSRWLISLEERCLALAEGARPAARGPGGGREPWFPPQLTQSPRASPTPHLPLPAPASQRIFWGASPSPESVGISCPDASLPHPTPFFFVSSNGFREAFGERGSSGSALLHAEPRWGGGPRTCHQGEDHKAARTVSTFTEIHLCAHRSVTRKMRQNLPLGDGIGATRASETFVVLPQVF